MINLKKSRPTFHVFLMCVLRKPKRSCEQSAASLPLISWLSHIHFLKQLRTRHRASSTQMANSVDVFTAKWLCGVTKQKSDCYLCTCAASKGTVNYVIQITKYNGHFEGHLKEGVSFFCSDKKKMFEDQQSGSTDLLKYIYFYIFEHYSMNGFSSQILQSRL